MTITICRHQLRKVEVENEKLEFAPAYMAWTDLSYDVDMPREHGQPKSKKRILKDVNGYK